MISHLPESHFNHKKEGVPKVEMGHPLYSLHVEVYICRKFFKYQLVKVTNLWFKPICFTSHFLCMVETVGVEPTSRDIAT